MLGLLRERLDFHIQAGNNSLHFFLKKPLSTLMTVVVIAISLTLPALFWVFADNLQQLSGDWKRGSHISLYLAANTSPSEQTDLLAQVRRTPGVGEASLKSSADGLMELQQQEGMQDIMKYLPENPLPAVIDIVPSGDMNTPEKVGQLYQALKSSPHVDQAKFDMQWINRLYTLLDIVDRIASGLMMLLASAVVLIIGNTLRMVIHHRHEEIHVLKLIGASDGYIIRPFLYLGICYGLAGALLALVLVYIMTLSLGHLVNQLVETYQMHYSFAGLSFSQVLLLLLSAMTLGWIGARLSVSSLCRSHVG